MSRGPFRHRCECTCTQRVCSSQPRSNPTSFKEALKSYVSPTSLRTGAALGLYVAIYRTLLQVLLIVRAKTLIPKIQAYAAQQQQQQTQQPGGGGASRSSSSKRVIIPEAPSTRSRAQRRILALLQSHSLAPMLASALASGAFALVPGALRAYVALDILVRGLNLVYNEARRQGSRVVSWVPDWVGGGLLYTLGNGQLLYAFLFEPKSFPSGYGNVILAVSASSKMANSNCQR